MDGGRPARRPTRCASSRGPNSIFFFSLWHYLAHPPPHAKAPHLHVSTGVHGHAPLSAIHLVPCHLAFQIRLIRHGVYNGSRLSSLHAAVSEFAVPSYCRSISDSAGRYIAFWQDLWRRPCQYPRCGSSINQATLCSVAPKRSAARLALYTRLPLSQSNHSTCHWLSSCSLPPPPFLSLSALDSLFPLPPLTQSPPPPSSGVRHHGGWWACGRNPIPWLCRPREHQCGGDHRSRPVASLGLDCLGHCRDGHLRAVRDGHGRQHPVQAPPGDVCAQGGMS